MGFVGEKVCSTAGGGHGAGTVETAFHEQFVEVAGNGNAVRRLAVFIQHAHDDIQRIAGGGGRGGYHSLFKTLPHSPVEAVLPLRGLVGIVEGLVIGIVHILPIVRRHQMPLAVAGNARLLPRGRDARILVPASVTAYAVPRVCPVVHHECTPQRRLPVAVHKAGVVSHHLSCR